MKSQDSTEEALKQLGELQLRSARTSAELDRRILGDAEASLAEQAARRAADAATGRLGFAAAMSSLMKESSTRYAAATAVAVLIILVLAMNHTTTTAWAIEDAIKAVQKYRAVHVVGWTMGPDGRLDRCELWMRSNPEETQSEAVLAKTDQATVWVAENQTYYYVPSLNKVLVDKAVTAGMNPWMGPRLLRVLSKARDSRIVESVDTATRQRRVLLTASLESASGPQSWSIEFDADSKLPISIEAWNNLDRHGNPFFSAEKITYFEDLPDRDFIFQPPSGVPYQEKDLVIPEANLALVADPKYGISTDGLSQEAAAHKILGELWTATIHQDYQRVRELCPVVGSWGGEFMREVFSGPDAAVELLSIGDIVQESHSRIGPIALVPTRILCKDGKIREINMLVQFRHSERGESCVVHGLYGFPVEIK
jgi:hypothetical protein